MNPLPLHALEILHRGDSIYGEVQPSRSDVRKWVKLTPWREAETDPFRYVVRSFELLAHQVEQEIDVAGFEENMIRREVEDLDAALVVLAELAPGPVEWQGWRDTGCPI